MSEPAEPTSAIGQVLRAEREWLLAHLRLDVQALDRLMAPEYRRRHRALAGQRH